MTTKSSNNIERWLTRKPESATTLRVSAKSLGTLQTVLELSAVELANGKRESASEDILDSCEAWTSSQGKEVQFLAQWLTDDDRPVLTLPFRIAPSNQSISGLPPIDGSLESLIASLQATGIAREKLTIELLSTCVGFFQSMLESSQTRIAFLEGQDLEVRRLKQELVDVNNSTGELASDNANQVWIKGVIEKLLEAKFKTFSNPANPRIL
jgi:hypothetical protein